MYRRTKIYGHYGNKIEDAQRKNGNVAGETCERNRCNSSEREPLRNRTCNTSGGVLLFYADRFDVSLDYIFGRTEKPQGKLYNYQPKPPMDSDEMRKFVEMCFDPKSPMNERLKQVLVDLLEQSKDSRDKG